ncbi:MAG: Fe-S-containing hydro-lyase [Deltaproteobacteria bacterium]|jgi:fumarate hydratase subunit beta|nr:Fe-S-containing hydro-lyase [Deltaproteobacteria bacterium]
MSEIKVTTPLNEEVISKWRSGDKILISGIIYTGRDAAHKRLVELIDKGESLPFDVKGQIIYFVGPTPARPGRAVGSAGPTTSYRMDAYSPRLIERGLKGMIGKGSRSKEVIEAMMKHRCVYMTAVGGAGALISRCIKSSEIIAYDDLGPEAIRKMKVENFPVIVVNDTSGNDLYQEGIKKYRKV